MITEVELFRKIKSLTEEMNDCNVILWNNTDCIKLIQQTKKEWERNNILYVLEKYNTWLLKEGYSDTDIIYELNINEFLNALKENGIK